MSKVGHGKYRVVLISLCANIIGFSLGTAMGWTSPMMEKLRDRSTDRPIQIGVTSAQEGWISALYPVGAFIVNFFLGSLATSIGRKWTLLLFSFLLGVSFILLIIATNIWFIYSARFLHGFGGAGVQAVIPMYIGEIATDDNRGALGSLMTIFGSAGVLYTYIIGPYVSYLTFQYCCLAIPTVFSAIFVFVPESPYYFAIKGKNNNLINSLKILRGKSAKEVDDEKIKIQKEVDESMSNRSRIIDILRNRVYRKALFITCGLLFFQEMCGSTVVTFNSQSIFISAGSALDPAIATIILGVVLMVSNSITPFVIERAGRKIILLVSSVGMAVALMTLGTFFYIKEFGNASNILWLPVPALIVFRASFGFGFFPVPCALLGEMFPSNIKSTATSMAYASHWLETIVILFCFPALDAVGPYYAFWMFGGFCILAFVFVKFFVIETKGLSLQMIQEKLKG